MFETVSTYTCNMDLSGSTRRRKAKPKSFITSETMKTQNQKCADGEAELSDEAIDVTNDFDDYPPSPPEVCVNIYDFLTDYEKENIDFASENICNINDGMHSLNLFDSSNSSFRVTDLTPLSNLSESSNEEIDADIKPIEKGTHARHKSKVKHSLTDLFNVDFFLKKQLVVSCEKLDLDEFCRKNDYVKQNENTVLLRKGMYNSESDDEDFSDDYNDEPDSYCQPTILKAMPQSLKSNSLAFQKKYLFEKGIKKYDRVPVGAGIVNRMDQISDLSESCNTGMNITHLHKVQLAPELIHKGLTSTTSAAKPGTFFTPSVELITQELANPILPVKPNAVFNCDGLTFTEEELASVLPSYMIQALKENSFDSSISDKLDSLDMSSFGLTSESVNQEDSVQSSIDLVIDEPLAAGKAGCEVLQNDCFSVGTESKVEVKTMTSFDIIKDMECAMSVVASKPCSTPLKPKLSGRAKMINTKKRPSTLTTINKVKDVPSQSSVRTENVPIYGRQYNEELDDLLFGFGSKNFDCFEKIVVASEDNILPIDSKHDNSCTPNLKVIVPNPNEKQISKSLPKNIHKARKIKEELSDVEFIKKSATKNTHDSQNIAKSKHLKKSKSLSEKMTDLKQKPSPETAQKITLKISRKVSENQTSFKITSTDLNETVPISHDDKTINSSICSKSGFSADKTLSSDDHFTKRHACKEKYDSGFVKSNVKKKSCKQRNETESFKFDVDRVNDNSFKSDFDSRLPFAQLEEDVEKISEKTSETSKSGHKNKQLNSHAHRVGSQKSAFPVVGKKFRTPALGKTHWKQETIDKHVIRKAKTFEVMSNDTAILSSSIGEVASADHTILPALIDISTEKSQHSDLEKSNTIKEKMKTPEVGAEGKNKEVNGSSSVKNSKAQRRSKASKKSISISDCLEDNSDKASNGCSVSGNSESSTTGTLDVNTTIKADLSCTMQTSDVNTAIKTDVNTATNTDVSNTSSSPDIGSTTETPENRQNSDQELSNDRSDIKVEEKCKPNEPVTEEKFSTSASGSTSDFLSTSVEVNSKDISVDISKGNLKKSIKSSAKVDDTKSLSKKDKHPFSIHGKCVPFRSAKSRSSKCASSKSPPSKATLLAASSSKSKGDPKEKQQKIKLIPVNADLNDAGSPDDNTPKRLQRRKAQKRPYSPTEEVPSNPSRNSEVAQTPVATEKGAAISTLASSKKTKNYSLEEVTKPFESGWMREVVHRATGKGIDIYYFNPEGRKLRSMPEVLKYLSEHKKCGLTSDNFTFTKEKIYREPFETERGARIRTGEAADSPASIKKTVVETPMSKVAKAGSSKLSTQKKPKLESTADMSTSSKSVPVSENKKTTKNHPSATIPKQIVKTDDIKEHVSKEREPESSAEMHGKTAVKSDKEKPSVTLPSVPANAPEKNSKTLDQTSAAKHTSGEMLKDQRTRKAPRRLGLDVEVQEQPKPPVKKARIKHTPTRKEIAEWQSQKSPIF